jgi:SAM-dependent methyltransferase
VPRAISLRLALHPAGALREIRGRLDANQFKILINQKENTRSMNRKWTNRIRFLMDECVPPLIRDSRWFMYPFYYYAYRGRNITTAMDFKKLYFEWSPAELQQFYAGINSVSTNRKTDISPAGLQFILQQCKQDIASVLDVGCGKGFLLQLLNQHYPHLQLHGADFVAHPGAAEFPFTQTDVRRMAIPDKSFDLVVCTHTIEHIYDAHLLVQELKRIARKKIIVITPRQRYFYYTLDEHVNFFPRKELLTSLMDMPDHECHNIEGDWVYMGRIHFEKTEQHYEAKAKREGEPRKKPYAFVDRLGAQFRPEPEERRSRRR